MNAYIIGSSTTKFGELWNISPRSLATEAVTGAVADANIKTNDIDALFVGNMLSGLLGGQEHLGAFFADQLGLNVPASKVEGACASGGLAVHAAMMAVISGMYETVCILGVEKMTDHKPEDVARALMGAGSQDERFSGITFPGLYAILARAHMKKFGTTSKQMASVAVKNHFHASLNKKAQFNKQITAEEVLRSTKIADPLRLLDCSPISDGASAVILTSKKPLLKKNKPVQVAASSVATDTLGLAGRDSLTELKATRIAAQKAYTDSSIGPSDVNVAEVHDCFTIAEILAVEDLGFYDKGEVADEIEKGKTRINSKKGIVVNTSGGLKGCGHPVGATGVKQIVEICDQLMGRAGDRQVAGAKVGLAHNVGGSGATAVVHILKK
ncbi:thiolase domain-containing protein [Patescibacteria group bacterium]